MSGIPFSFPRAARPYFDPPNPVALAIATVNDAMGRLRLVVEHRGGVMMPFDGITTIGLCDGFHINIDASAALRVFAKRGGVNMRANLLAQLAEHPSEEEMRAESAETVAGLDLTDSLKNAVGQVLFGVPGQIENKPVIIRIIRCDERDGVKPVGAVDLNLEGNILKAALALHSTSPDEKPEPKL